MICICLLCRRTAPREFPQEDNAACTLHTEGSIYDSAVCKLALRIVSVSRPGMGQSTLHPGCRLLDWPPQLLALANHLRIGRFAARRLGRRAVSAGVPPRAAPKAQHWRRHRRGRVPREPRLGGHGV
ncbi:hypothetical protein Micbo1qcDRAFT_212448 [Microdochium bolleyi]|uniref:Uncharacterized protein n=1 Tax=Microdochium bolleyi TaxID=196109 RepID=A0A136IYE9_9PEZI|nr:hypothetical protein Micbo1qcDRAFT_212448 [Microdochium bolleyi]